ncbi:MAG: hypothetical protein ABL973_06925 [Micropepsaceae bacterium]
MKTHQFTAILLALVVATACGDQSAKQNSGSPPVRLACTTPEQAGMKAADITRKLVEQKKQGVITQDQYTAFNITLSQGLTAWAERQDLKAYCAALDRVVQDASLK